MRYLLILMVVAMFSCKQDTPAVTSNTTDAQVEKNNTSGVDNTPPAQISDNKAADAAKPAKSAQPAYPKTMGGGKKGTNYNKEGIPDACDLLDKATIAKYVNQPVENIFLADGSSPQNLKARACFFKWDGSALPNAGVMVQLQKNPVATEVPEYFTYLISSKKTDGEKDPGTQSVFKYNDWEGFGDDGAYSTEAGKYVWRVGNDWAFMVAFNTVLRPEEQKKAAEVFAREVMANMEI